VRPLEDASTGRSRSRSRAACAGAASALLLFFGCGSRTPLFSSEEMSTSVGGSSTTASAGGGGQAGAAGEGGEGGSAGGEPFFYCPSFEWAGPAIPLTGSPGFYSSLAMAPRTGDKAQLCVGTRTLAPDVGPAEAIACFDAWGPWPPPETPTLQTVLPVASLKAALAPATSTGLAILADSPSGGFFFLDDRQPFDDTPPSNEPFYPVGPSRPLFVRRSGGKHVFGVAEALGDHERVFVAMRGDGLATQHENLGCALTPVVADALVRDDDLFIAAASAQQPLDCSVQPQYPPYVVHLSRVGPDGVLDLLSTTGGAGLVWAVRLLPGVDDTLWYAIRYDQTFSLAEYDLFGMPVGGFFPVLHNGPVDVAIEPYAGDVLVAHVDTSDPDLAGDILIERYVHGAEASEPLAGFDTADEPFGHDLALAVAPNGRHILLGWIALAGGADVPVVRRLDCVE
jgi:hypothetical protein